MFEPASLPDAPDRGPAAVAQVTPFDVSSYDPPGQVAVAGRAAEFYKALDAGSPVRWLTVVRHTDPAGSVRYLQALRADCGPAETARRSGLAALATFVRVLVEGTGMRHATHYLLTWTGEEYPAPILFSHAASAFGTRVTPVAGLPPLFGAYRASWDHLVPQAPGQPWAAVWGSTAFLGHLDWGVIGRLVRLPFPCVLALDVETRSPDAAEWDLETAYASLTTHRLKQARGGGYDARAAAALADVVRAKDALQHNERLHRCTVTVLVWGATRRELRAHGARLRTRLRPYIRFRPLWGEQAAALGFFTATPRARIPVDLKARPLLSSGAALLLPAAFPSRPPAGGLVYGRDRGTGELVCDDGWTRPPGEGALALHHVFLGKTGYGKTFAMLCLLYRMILIYNARVVVMAPVPHFARLAPLLGAGARCQRVAFGQATLNLLDPVFPQLADQVVHVRRMLAVLLTCGGGGGGRRLFNEDEQAALEEALQALYAPLWPATATLPPAAVPRLSDLADGLAATPGGASLARTLRRLFVSGSLAATFNPPGGTNLDWRFDTPYTAIDVEGVDRDYRPLFYGQFVARLHAPLTDPARTVPLVLAFDEYQILSQDSGLAAEFNRLAKLARWRRAAVWTATQFVPDYLHNEDSRQVLANAGVVLLGLQEHVSQDVYRQLWPRLTDGDLDALQALRRGEFLAQLGDSWLPLQIDPAPLELAAFSGT